MILVKIYLTVRCFRFSCTIRFTGNVPAHHRNFQAAACFTSTRPCKHLDVLEVSFVIWMSENVVD
ncbi:unnamed protein product [Brassica oleracea]